MPSSMCSQSLTLFISAHTTAVRNPITAAIHTLTYPAAGVMPTSPAMAPSQAPTTLNLPLCRM